jgi:hypothetical protein
MHSQELKKTFQEECETPPPPKKMWIKNWPVKRYTHRRQTCTIGLIELEKQPHNSKEIQETKTTSSIQRRTFRLSYMTFNLDCGWVFQAEKHMFRDMPLTLGWGGVSSCGIFIMVRMETHIAVCVCVCVCRSPGFSCRALSSRPSHFSSCLRQPAKQMVLWSALQTLLYSSPVAWFAVPLKYLFLLL